MAQDGNAEAEAINAVVAGLGEWYEGGLADDDTPTLGASGAPVGYRVTNFGNPVPTARDRGMGVTEAGQPHVLPITVIHVAGSAKDTREMVEETNRGLIGLIPVPGDSGDIRALGGYSMAVRQSEQSPTEWHRTSWFEVNINLDVEQLAP